MRRLLVIALAAAIACKDHSAPTAVADTPHPAAVSPNLATPPDAAPPPNTVNPAVKEADVFDETCGIYFQGQKVGWMHTALGRDGVMITELLAKVGAMGTVTEVRFDEKRTYDNDGKLVRITFSQAATTGEVRVTGERHGDSFDVTTTAGGKSSTQSVKIDETIADALEIQHLAAAAKVGATATSKRYDPSVQKIVVGNHKVAGIEHKLFAGIDTEVVRVDTEYPELGINESMWLDTKGQTLESQIGGYFVARLEPPEVAKRLDYSQDLLVAAVVAVPKGIENQADIKKLTVRFSGFGETTPPTSPRQKVAKNGDEVTLSLSRETPPKQPWHVGEALKAESPDDLAATPFIQSDDSEVIAAAKTAVGDASDVYTATSRLAEFVFAYIEDEYVPAYSNALEALKSRRGDCTEHSILFVALARALGIPARVAVGIAYWKPGHGFGWHAWAEVYAGGTWYTVDPTWNQPIADVTHVKLADGGPAQQARIVMLLGRLHVVDVRT